MNLQTEISIEDIKKAAEKDLNSRISANSLKASEGELRNYENEEYDQILKFRKEYATKFWKLTLIYLILVGAYLLFSTVEKIYLCEYIIDLKFFYPSDTVIIALLSTTMANIIAVLLIFAKFVFPADGIKKKL